MQLNDAKKYLIFILILLNLGLLYGIAKENIKYDKSFTKKNIKSLEHILEKNNIKVDVKLNTKKQKLSPLSVTYARLDDDEYEKLRQNYKDIQIIDDFYMELHHKKNIQNIDELRLFAEQFIKENFDKYKYYLKEEINDSENIMVVYEELNSSMFLDTSYIKFIYNDTGNVNISLLKIKDIQNIDTDIKIISNAQAVARLIPKLDRGDEIVSIELGYSILEEDEEKQMSAVRLLPFYRAKVNNDRYVYVMAME